MLEKLVWEASFLVTLGEKVQAVLPSFASFSGVGCIRNFCGIRGKLKEDSKFKCQTCESQEENIIENCPGMELKDHSLEIVERFYLSGTIGAGGMQLTVL